MATNAAETVIKAKLKLSCVSDKTGSTLFYGCVVVNDGNTKMYLKFVSPRSSTREKPTTLVLKNAVAHTSDNHWVNVASVTLSLEGKNVKVTEMSPLSTVMLSSIFDIEYNAEVLDLDPTILAPNVVLDITSDFPLLLTEDVPEAVQVMDASKLARSSVVAISGYESTEFPDLFPGGGSFSYNPEHIHVAKMSIDGRSYINYFL